MIERWENLQARVHITKINLIVVIDVGIYYLFIEVPYLYRLIPNYCNRY